MYELLDTIYSPYLRICLDVFFSIFLLIEYSTNLGIENYFGSSGQFHPPIEI